MKQRRAPSWWVENLFRPMIIAAMLACLVVPLVLVLEWFAAPWDGTYFLIFAFFAGLEGILSERALRQRGITGPSYLVSRAAEFLVLLLVLKFVAYIPLGFDRLLADAYLWSTDINTFVTNMDLGLGLLFLPLWAGAIYVARVVMELDLQARDQSPPPDKTSTEYYLWLTRPSPLRDSRRVLKSLGELFVWGGVFLLVASMVIHFLISSAQALVLPTLLYFALGIALMSQGQFSMLHAGWQVQSVPVQRGIARRWLLWVTIFVVAVALLASLLPTLYTVGPFQALLGVLIMLMNVLSFIVLLFFFLLLLPLSLFFPGMEQPERPSFRPEPLVPSQTVEQRGSSMLEIVVSAVFWTVVLFILTYSLYRFFQDRLSSLSDEEIESAWWGRLVAWLRDLWRRLRIWQHATQSRLVRRRAKIREERPVVRRSWRSFFPGRLPPREMVRYFYLSATQRAGQAGQGRQPGQTPYEYRGSLDERFPELEPDLTGLTEAFVQARYSRHPVQQEEVDEVKPLWQRIKRALRRRRVRL